MQQLIYDSGFIYIPDSPDELTRDQFISIAEAMHSTGNALKSALLVLRKLSGKSKLQFLLLKNEVKVNALPYIKWAFDDLKITRQLIPMHRGFYGPKTELENLTLSEFYFAEQFYSDYIKDKQNEALHNLIAVLYRIPKREYDKHKDLDGDIREPFRATAIPWFCKVIARWPMPVKQAILMWYDACREKIKEDNPDIFTSTGSSEPNDDEADMFGILRGLSGGKYGDFEKVEKLPLHTALYELNFLIAENRRLEAEIKK